MSKFAEVCIEAYKDWEATLPDMDSLPEPKYSRRHKRQMKKLFNKMRDNRYHRYTTGAIRVAAAAAIITVLFAVAFAIPSSREIIVDKFEEFSQFTMANGSNNIIYGIEVGYIPEGYTLIREGEPDRISSYQYENSDGKMILVHKCSPGGSLRVDSEGGTTEEILIGNITYAYITNSSDIHHVIWTVNDYIYHVSAPVSKEELIKIATNVK